MKKSDFFINKKKAHKKYILLGAPVIAFTIQVKDNASFKKDAIALIGYAGIGLDLRVLYSTIVIYMREFTQA